MTSFKTIKGEIEEYYILIIFGPEKCGSKLDRTSPIFNFETAFKTIPDLYSFIGQSLHRLTGFNINGCIENIGITGLPVNR